MALTLSVGFVVDDAIVMLENIVRHMEMGKPRLQAALDGSKEIAFTIVSMTLSLAAVFIPVLFMGGVVGRLMHEFAVTIVAAHSRVGPRVADAHADARQPVPEGAARNPPRPALQRRWSAEFDAWLQRLLVDPPADDSLQGRHDARLGRAAGRHRVPVHDHPDGVHPQRGHGAAAAGRSRSIQGLGFDAAVARIKDVMNVLRDDPNVASYTANVFGSGGRLNVDLKPRDERTLTADQVIQELRPKLARIPGIRVFLTNPPAIRIGGMMTRSQYQYTLQDPDTEELYRVAPGFEAALRRIDGIEDVTSDLQLRNPQVTVDLNRDQIAALGLTVDQVELALLSSYGSRQVSQIFARRRPVPGHPAGGPAVPARPGGALDAVRAGVRRTAWCRCRPS